MAAMTSKLKIFVLVFFPLSFVSTSSISNHEFSDIVIKIFLEREYNSTDSDWILKSARESYLYLKRVEENLNNNRLNFVKNYGNFLLKLFEEIHTESFDVHQLFLKENAFLKEYNYDHTASDFNITKLKTMIEDLQINIERHLKFHYNSSKQRYEASEVLNLNDTNFNIFLKEKIRADYSEIGYFFLEVFATLIGLSWGIISTVMHYTQSNIESAS